MLSVLFIFIAILNLENYFPWYNQGRNVRKMLFDSTGNGKCEYLI